MKLGRLITGKDPISSIARRGILHVVHDNAARHIETDLLHGLFEEFAILALSGWHSYFAPDHLHAVAFENTGLIELHGKV